MIAWIGGSDILQLFRVIVKFFVHHLLSHVKRICEQDEAYAAHVLRYKFL